jgi:hypothetical protein
MFTQRGTAAIDVLPDHTKLANWALSAELLLFALQPNRRLQAELSQAKAALRYAR